MDFDVVLEQGDSGYWIVSVPSLPGCYSQGRTEEEALKNVEEAILLMLETEKPRPVRIAHVRVT